MEKLSFAQVEAHMIRTLKSIYKKIDGYDLIGNDQVSHEVADKYLDYMYYKLDNWYMKHFNTTWTAEYGHTNEEFHDMIESDMFFKSSDGYWYLGKGATGLAEPFMDDNGQHYIMHTHRAGVSDVKLMIKQYVHPAEKELAKIA